MSPQEKRISPLSLAKQTRLDRYNHVPIQITNPQDGSGSPLVVRVTPQVGRDIDSATNPLSKPAQGRT